jgi:hypothetical protein
VLSQQVQEGLLVLIPAEAILCVGDLESLEVKLPEKTLVAIAVGVSEDSVRTIAFVSAPLDQASTSKKCEAGTRGAPC